MRMFPTDKKKLDTRGFSLVELMVSLSVFSIVMVVSVGTLLIMIDINAKAQALYSSMTNLSFALDSMTREIRTGYHYYCKTSTNSDTESMPAANTTLNCPSGGNFISFWREKDNVQMAYRLKTNADGTSVIQQKVQSGSWLQLTADDVVIDTFELRVENSGTYYGASDSNQPTIDLLIDGHVNNGLESDTDFNMQSHIVQRRLDLI